MPVLTSPPLIGGAGKPVTGRVALAATASYEWTDGVGAVHHVTTVPQAGVVRDGQFFALDGTTQLTLIPTPVNVGMRIVLHLEEQGAARGEHQVSRVVTVPEGPTVAWGDLVDVVPPVTGGDYVVPPWASDVITYRDQAGVSATNAATSATSASTSATAASDAKVAAEAARDRAEAVPTSNDTIIADRINTAATASRAAVDARANLIADQATAAAAERFFTGMRQATRDVNAVIAGDSTGDATYRWPREWALLLAAAFPTWTVKYATWNNTTRVWNATETLQTGTNTRTVTVWNASISGGSTYTHQAPDAGPIISSKDPDVVFVNHGHNEGSPAWTSNNTRLSFQARYVALCEDIRRHSPQAGIVCVGQNPPQAGVAFMAEKTTVIKTLAAMRGYGVADCTQAYIDAGTPASLYETDLLHPNAAGGKLMADTIWAAVYAPGPVAPGFQPVSVYTDPRARNLLTNGDFTALDATTFVPTGWLATRTTCAKDTANYEDAKRGYGLRLTSTGGGQAFIYQAVLDATSVLPMRGRYVTLLVRLRNNATAAKTTAGRVSLLDGVQVVDGITDPWSFGGFVWRALTLKIADTATFLQTRIYCDYGTDGTPDVTVDGAWLTEGTLPRKAD